MRDCLLIDTFYLWISFSVRKVMYSMNVDDGVVLMNVEYYERAVV